MKKNLIVLSGLGLAFMPFVASAAVTSGCQSASGLFQILCVIGQLLNYIVPILIALGVVYFVWGVISYVIGKDEEAKKRGRDIMIYGIIGLAVIIAMWGLVGILTKTFGLDNPSAVPLPPTVNIQPQS